jgi:hypothetical protein
MKRYTTKLLSEISVGPFEINVLDLIVQLIVMSETVYSRATTTRNNSPDKLANLNDSIRCQLMQLHPEPTQNIQKD